MALSRAVIADSAGIGTLSLTIACETLGMVSETNQIQPFETKDPGDPGRYCGKVRALGPDVSRPVSYDRVAMVFASMVQYHQARFGDQQAAAGDEKRNEASRGCSSGSRWKTRDEE